LVPPRRKNHVPEPSRTRTDRDPAMIMLGAGLILLFLAAGALSLMGTADSGARKIRGPVKDPSSSELILPDAPLSRGSASLGTSGTG